MASHEIGTEIDQTVAINCRRFESIEESKSFFTDLDSFKVMTLNIRSLNRNFDAFEVALKRIDTPFEVIILTECWLNEYSTINRLPGYNVYHTSKCINKSGGIAVYVRESLDALVSEPSFDDANCLSVTISDRLKIFGVYRSPSFHNKDKFLVSLDRALNESKGFHEVVVIGDINIDIMDSSNQSSDYLYLMAMHEFLPAITTPTRNGSCLDHIFIKSKSLSIGAVCQCSITDHDIVMAAIFAPNNKASKRPRWTTKTDFVAAARELRAANWSEVINSTNVNEAVTLFDQIVSTALKNNTSRVKVSRSKLNLKPWITPGLIRCMKHRDKLHSKARAAPNDHVLQTIYKRYRNFFDNLLYNLKIDYQSKQLTEARGNPKKLWQTIKKVCHSQISNNSANELTSLLNSPKESLNVCNEHFATVGQNLAVNILSKLSETQSSLASKLRLNSATSANSFFFHPTDANEIGKIISSLKSDSAPGPDSARPLFIKEIRDVILEPLTYIFNLSLVSGCFPDRWKLAQVTPIYKNGRKDDPNNYRPISLLSVFSKILEKIVNSRLTAFLDKHKVLSDNQFGFRKGKSTEDAAIYLSNKISSFIDGGEKCVGVFLDLCKAFDTVSKDILLRKLDASGVRGISLEWFRSYLTDRRQVVKVGENSSDQMPISFGVPQGSILGPTLFLIYVNDILKLQMHGAEVICYADDTAILFHGKTWEDTFNITECGLSDVGAWLDSNLLTLNVTKSNFLAFSKTSAASAPPNIYRKITIHCNMCPNLLSDSTVCSCSRIARSEKVKYLGLLIDENLSFKQHISALCGRVRKCIYIMKKLRYCTSEELLRIVYYALCQSILQFGIIVWGSAPKTTLLQLERAQRAVIKVMFKKPFLFPTADLYRETKLLSVRRLYILKAVARAHAAIINLPNYKQLLSKRKFRVPLPNYRSALAKRSPDFMHLRIYNNICQTHSIQRYAIGKVKVIIKEWLVALSYHDTEVLLLAC